MWEKALIGDDGSQVRRKGLLLVLRTNLERLEPMPFRTQLYRMWDIALRIGTLENPSQCEGFGMWALLIMSKGFYIEHLEMDFQHFWLFISGNGRRSCEPEFNSTGYEGEWSAFDPLPKLTQASDTDVRIIVGKERESYEPELNSRMWWRTPMSESLDWYSAERHKQKTGSQCESVLFRNLLLSQFNKALRGALFLDICCFDKVL